MAPAQDSVYLIGHDKSVTIQPSLPGPRNAID